MSSCGWFPLGNDEIMAWVEAHRDQLPTTLAELATYPVAFRRVIINCVSVETRTQLWQEHLRSFLAPSAGLTPEQATFIEETAIPSTIDIFRSESREVMHSKMRPLESQLRDMFPREQAA